MQVLLKTWVSMGTMMALLACGSDANGDGGDTTPSGGPLNLAGQPAFGLIFSPMYSAFDGTHDFQVPVVPQGGVAVDKWEITNAQGAVQTGVADFAKEDSFGGAMIKIRKAGDYFVVAHAGKQTGWAELHVTAATPEQWAMGEARYNNSIMLDSLVPMTGMMVPKDPSCKNCHGTGASFLDVEHTPQQTGGYSDTDLIGIITTGTKPPNSTSKSGIPLMLYKYFHTWIATAEEQQGLVVYLRSFQPKSQGAIDFGGVMMPRTAGPAGGAAGAAGGAAGSGM
jgi:hypothetical protein